MFSELWHDIVPTHTVTGSMLHLCNPLPAWTLCSHLEPVLLSWTFLVEPLQLNECQCFSGLCSSSHFNYGTATVPPTFLDDKWWITSVKKNLWIIQKRDECKLNGMALYQLLWVLCWKIVRTVVITKGTSR